MSPDKPREVKIDIEDGPTEDRRRRRVHSPSSPEKRRSATSRSTTEATTITDQEDAPSLIPLSIVFGVVTLPRVKLLASIGGLILETEIREMSVSCSRKEEAEKNCEGLNYFFIFCRPNCRVVVGKRSTVLANACEKESGPRFFLQKRDTQDCRLALAVTENYNS